VVVGSNPTIIFRNSVAQLVEHVSKPILIYLKSVSVRSEEIQRRGLDRQNASDLSTE